MGDEVKNIFISHIHEDDRVLKDLKDLLVRSGREFRDGSIDSSKPNEAKDPDYIKTTILAPRIRWAGVMVVLLSPDTCKSGYVNWEIEYAHKQEKRIVGVWSQGDKGCEIPENLEKYADAVVGWQAERVLDAIDGKLNNWYNPAGEERPPREIARFNC